MNSPFDRYRTSWGQKPLLRRVYNDIYDRIAADCVRGITVEIGGGIGQFKMRFPEVIATDIQSAPWLDLVTDAQNLPFASASIANIVMVDVLHHVSFHSCFYKKPSGRCVLAVVSSWSSRRSPGGAVCFIGCFMTSRSG